MNGSLRFPASTLAALFLLSSHVSGHFVFLTVNETKPLLGSSGWMDAKKECSQTSLDARPCNVDDLIMAGKNWFSYGSSWAQFGDFFAARGEAKVMTCTDDGVENDETCHEGVVVSRSFTFPDAASGTKRKTYCCLQYKKENCRTGYDWAKKLEKTQETYSEYVLIHDDLTDNWISISLVTRNAHLRKIKEWKKDVVLVHYCKERGYDMTVWNTGSVRRRRSLEDVSFTDPDLASGISLSGWGGEAQAPVSPSVYTGDVPSFPYTCSPGGWFHPIQYDNATERFFCVTPFGGVIDATVGANFSAASSPAQLWRCRFSHTFNFLRSSAVVPADAEWHADRGYSYATRLGTGLSFGWDTNIIQFFTLPVTEGDLLYSTGVSLPNNQETYKSIWRVSLPNGPYLVSVSVGRHLLTRNSVYVNGIPFMLDFEVKANTRHRQADIVLVDEGYLTLDTGSLNHFPGDPKASATFLNFVSATQLDESYYKAVCWLPWSDGDCGMLHPDFEKTDHFFYSKKERIYYHSAGGVCVRKKFLGCQGNHNRFPTEEVCQILCGGQSLCPEEGPIVCKNETRDCRIEECKYHHREVECFAHPCACDLRFRDEFAREINCSQPIAVCLRTYQDAVVKKQEATSAADLNKIHVPSCREDGSFDPLQCQGSVCWCVDDAGIEIDGTSVVDSEPSCSRRQIENVDFRIFLEGSFSSVEPVVDWFKGTVYNKFMFEFDIMPETVWMEIKEALGVVGRAGILLHIVVTTNDDPVIPGDINNDNVMLADYVMRKLLLGEFFIQHQKVVYRGIPLLSEVLFTRRSLPTEPPGLNVVLIVGPVVAVVGLLVILVCCVCCCKKKLQQLKKQAGLPKINLTETDEDVGIKKQPMVRQTLPSSLTVQRVFKEVNIDGNNLNTGADEKKGAALNAKKILESDSDDESNSKIESAIESGMRRNDLGGGGYSRGRTPYAGHPGYRGPPPMGWPRGPRPGYPPGPRPGFPYGPRPGFPQGPRPLYYPPPPQPLQNRGYGGGGGGNMPPVESASSRSDWLFTQQQHQLQQVKEEENAATGEFDANIGNVGGSFTSPGKIDNDVVEKKEPVVDETPPAPALAPIVVKPAAPSASIGLTLPAVLAALAPSPALPPLNASAVPPLGIDKDDLFDKKNNDKSEKKVLFSDEDKKSNVGLSSKKDNDVSDEEDKKESFLFGKKDKKERDFLETEVTGGKEEKKKKKKKKTLKKKDTEDPLFGGRAGGSLGLADDFGGAGPASPFPAPLAGRRAAKAPAPAVEADLDDWNADPFALKKEKRKKEKKKKRRNVDFMEEEYGGGGGGGGGRRGGGGEMDDFWGKIV